MAREPQQKTSAELALYNKHENALASSLILQKMET